MRAGGGGRLLAAGLPAEASASSSTRGPAGGGFPAAGKSDAIKRVNERNRIELVATGAEDRGVVNGKEVAKVTDSNPGQVTGPQDPLRARQPPRTRTRTSIATFKRVAVAVPDP